VKGGHWLDEVGQGWTRLDSRSAARTCGRVMVDCQLPNANCRLRASEVKNNLMFLASEGFRGLPWASVGFRKCGFGMVVKLPWATLVSFRGLPSAEWGKEGDRRRETGGVASPPLEGVSPCGGLILRAFSIGQAVRRGVRFTGGSGFFQGRKGGMFHL